jgi:hypothetical protein
MESDPELDPDQFVRGADPDPLVRDTDPRIRIRTKMIPNTAFNDSRCIKVLKKGALLAS